MCRGACFPLAIDADVAHWIKWSVKGNHVRDLVRRPGTFVGKTFQISGMSNADITVSFAGFANLTSTTNSQKTLTASYALSTEADDPSDIETWTAAGDFSGALIIFDGTEKNWTVWEKIEVPAGTPPHFYEDPTGATMTLSTFTMKPWLATNGNYKETGIP